MKNKINLEELLEECERLEKENLYLKSLLSKMMNNQVIKENQSTTNIMVNNYSPAEAKVKLFKSLFKGRTDVYATRWESKSGKSGYIPACAHEWQKPICLNYSIS